MSEKGPQPRPDDFLSGAGSRAEEQVENTHTFSPHKDVLDDVVTLQMVAGESFRRFLCEVLKARLKARACSRTLFLPFPPLRRDRSTLRAWPLTTQTFLTSFHIPSHPALISSWTR